MKQILLVEDDEIMRITVYDRLVQEKWQVDAVTNGREARGKLEQKHYHLILSDIRMPGMGGMELLELAKRLGAAQVFLHNFKCSGKGMEHRFELDLEPAEWREFYREALTYAGNPAWPEISFDDPILASLGARDAEHGIPGSTCGQSARSRPSKSALRLPARCSGPR